MADTDLEGPAGAATRSHGWRTLLFALAIAQLGACTMVRVSDASGVRTTYYPGVAVVRIAAGNAMQVADVRSLGLTVVSSEASLGWLRSRTALVPPDRCQLLLWHADAAAAAELGRRIGPRTELCTQEGELE